MKFNKKMLFDMFIVIFITVYFFPVPGRAQPADAEFGAIFIAHGAMHRDWNAEIERQCGEFGLAISPTPWKPSVILGGFGGGIKTLREAIRDLRSENSSLREVLLVHLSPSSYSMRHEDIKSTAEGIASGLSFQIAPAMDDHPLAVDILRDYSNEFYVSDSSRSPADESLILLGYGPAEELDNIVWLRMLERIGERIRAELGFKEVACMTLRLHSADLIRSQAIADLQRTAKRLRKQGKVIVVPYVLYIIPNGSFQRELKSYLRGIIDPEDICTKGVISHPNTKEWIKEVVIENRMDQPMVRPINRNWSAMDRAVGGNSRHKYGRVKIEVSEHPPQGEEAKKKINIQAN